MSKNHQYCYCMVPKCKNTSVSAPDKQFISVPKDAIVRKQWCDAINRCNKQNVLLSCKTTRYCCEDHFDLPNDMENFIKHKIMGLGNRQLKPKKGVLPHMFDCQRTSTVRQRMTGAEHRGSKFNKGVLGPKRRKDENSSGSNLRNAEKAIQPKETIGSYSCAMDLRNTESVTIKTEPGTQEGDGGEMDIDIEIPDIKEECFEYSEGNDRRTVTWTREKNIQNKHDSNSSENYQCKELVNSTSKSFSCSDCDYVCSRKLYLKSHMLAHDRENTFSCSDCNYLCTGKARLRKHMLTHTREKPFSCTYCSYLSSEKSHLKRHMLTHGGEKPFSCPECTFSCSLNDNLKRHFAVTHSEEKAFSCSDCEYLCSRKSLLKDHILTHSLKKPFACPDCNYSSSYRFNLNTHILTHSGEKPFSCLECNYSFSNRAHLNSHMLTHSGEKPFSCPDCNYSSARMSRLKSHMLTHSGD